MDVFYWLSVFLILVSTVALSWSLYSALFHPTQWLNPYGKTILITGCDSGIGFELAKHFHQKGSTVLATVLSLEGQGAKELRSQLSYDRLYLVEMDLTKLRNDDEPILKIRKILKNHKLALHAVINNAGVFVFGEFDFYTFNHIESQVNVNLLGTIYFLKYLMSDIIKSQARIINVSSVISLVPYPGLGVYSATKAAIESFTESLSVELDRFNVKTVLVRLGDYSNLTQLMTNHERIIREQYDQLDDEQRKRYAGYFYAYHQSALKNRGLFGPKSFAESSLFDDFDEATYVVQPKSHIFSATFSYKLLVCLLYWMPRSLRRSLFFRFNKLMVKD